MEERKWLTSCQECGGAIISNETTVVARDSASRELWSTERACENGHVTRVEQWLRADQIAVADAVGHAAASGV